MSGFFSLLKNSVALNFKFKEKMKVNKMKRFKICLRSSSGRNSKGRLTAFRKGGGFKKHFTLIDFNRRLIGIPALVYNFLYDSFRSSFISLVLYKNGFLSYILSPRALKIGDVIFSSFYAFLYKVGDTLPLRFMQIGTLVHNVELIPGVGGKLLRSAGVYGKV
jgi:large subunit ribosomal protein L2